MPPSVLYYCPCDIVDPTPSTSSLSSSSSSPPISATTAASTAVPSPASASAAAAPIQLSLSHPPNLPSASAAAAYAFYPLDTLYFCDECDQIRCSRCVSIEIAAYFCPNCLYEVPHASIKQSKNQCTRNCFNCPACRHVLSVVATDIDDDFDDGGGGGGSSAGPALTSPDASLGRPPYFLQCSFCMWDSKGVGLTFDKPTGLGRQLDKLEQSAPDLLELYHLRDHLDPYITAQADAAQAAASLAHSRHAAASANKSSSGSGSSSSTARPRASGASASLASSSALQKSKLLRDIPQLASSGYLTGVAEKPRPHRREEKEDLKPYDAFTSWTSGCSNDQQKGVLGRREESRYDFLSQLTGPDARVSSLQQRWTSLWDQPVRSADLPPTRIALRCKQSKRCPTCRHIIIKPDLKAESRRFKIKLVAFNYVPEIELELAAHQPFLHGSGAIGAAGASGAGAGGAAGSAGASSRLSRRTSMLGLASGAGGGNSSGSLRRRPMSMLGGPSSSFSTDLSIDEESLQPGKTYVFEATFTNPLDDAMRIKLGVARISTSSRHVVSNAVPIYPEFEPSTATATGQEARPNWSVTPSTTSFSVQAYNEVWDMDEGAGMDLRPSSSVPPTSTNSSTTSSSRSDIDPSHASSSDEGIVRQKGHTTTISFDVTLGRDVKEGSILQLPVLVTYTPIQEEGRGTPFTFWIAMRFGSVARKQDVEAKKKVLEKRRSVLGLSGAGREKGTTTPAGRGLGKVTETDKVKGRVMQEDDEEQEEEVTDDV